MVNEWMDVSFKVGESKPEEYRFRPKRSSIHWFYGFSDDGNPFFSQFNIDEYDYQIPNKEDKKSSPPKWEIEYSNINPADFEYWTVTNGDMSFRTYFEPDAIFLAEKLNHDL